MTEIAILGPGGVGGFLAAALARAGQSVSVVAREGTAEAILRSGIEVQSVRLGNFSARPAALPALTEPVDVLFVATKATTLPEALDRVHSQPRLVVPLLNGLEHMTLLRERLASESVAAGVIRIESSSPGAGQIRQTSPFLRVDLASDDPRLRPDLEDLAGILDGAGVPARIGVSEAHVLWSKLVRLVALACTTSASGHKLGFIRSDPEWRQALEGVIEEAASVANADGADVNPAGPLGELSEAHPGLGSSMQRDIAAGKEPELDAIAGAVLRAGRRHGIECPTIERLSLSIAGRAGLAQPRG
ncbi:MAG: 2-dehydropantoate 2-reductase [Solirubrobacterales bacterium]|nr:2-dehydropantoate 2-reductase [Solirubrobacterales bacterium]